ncbi:MAG: tryptophan synthase subunit alpha [Rhodospirillales bacterium]|nr:tryptophan synthase subunit alpha [Alphaproteobacteria bacterium]USO03991.1 MAG: tryptophan synthase subunit alpha [Rhodospirillales bacterium]
MNRIEARFNKLKEEGRKALVTFITAGDPDAKKSLSVLKKLPESGADFIEIGMPFSDPMADGPAIQASSLRALQNGMTLKNTLELLQQFRTGDTKTPVILMGYFNPVLAYGIENFVTDAVQSGADGLIIVDLPPEEAQELQGPADEEGLCLIRLVTPTTDERRLEKILEGASGFLYYVSITGITGTKSANVQDVDAHIQRIKKQTNLPVLVGFGIKTPEDAGKMADIADGVVVGSAIVENMQKNQNDNNLSVKISDQVKKLSAAL